MLGNRVYDLMAQIVEESKSLKRIRECYLPEAAHDPAAKKIWEKMEAQKEENIGDLMEILKNHI